MAEKVYKTLEEAAAAAASLEVALQAEQVKNEVLTTQVDELTEKLASEKEQATKVINSISMKLETTEKVKNIKNATQTFQGSVYEFTIPQFRLDGKVHKAADLKKDDPIIGQLLEIGFAGIKLVTTKTK